MTRGEIIKRMGEIVRQEDKPPIPDELAAEFERLAWALVELDPPFRIAPRS